CAALRNVTYLFFILFTSLLLSFPLFFFFTHTAPTDIYTLSLHDALPIYAPRERSTLRCVSSELGGEPGTVICRFRARHPALTIRSEEHTSELQSRGHLVCRLLLEKKKKKTKRHIYKRL